MCERAIRGKFDISLYPLDDLKTLEQVVAEICNNFCILFGVVYYNEVDEFMCHVTLFHSRKFEKEFVATRRTKKLALKECHLRLLEYIVNSKRFDVKETDFEIALQKIMDGHNPYYKPPYLIRTIPPEDRYPPPGKS